MARRSVRLALLLLALSLPTGANAEASYDDMVAELKSGFTDIDYTSLRNAYAQSAHYDPYFESGQHKAMVAAVKTGDCAGVMAAANALLAANFTDIEAHVLAADCARRLNDASTARYHREVARGLLSSIASSGDGKRPETAFVVIAVDEEYAWILAEGDRVKERSLMAAGGHQCDAVEVDDGRGGTSTVYFNVDTPMAWLAKRVASSTTTTQTAPATR